MNRVPSLALRVLGAALIFCFGLSRIEGQTPATPPQAQKPATASPAQEPEETEEDESPFAPQPAPVLPAGMTGSDAAYHRPS